MDWDAGERTKREENNTARPGTVFIKLLRKVSYLGEGFKSRFLYFYPNYFNELCMLIKNNVFHKDEKFH